MMRRAVGAVASTLNLGDKHVRAVTFVRDLLRNKDADLVAYFIDHQIELWSLVPPALESAGALWLMKHTDLINLTQEEFLAAAIEARPDLAELLRLPQAQRWVRRLIDPLGED